MCEKQKEQIRVEQDKWLESNQVESWHTIVPGIVQNLAIRIDLTVGSGNYQTDRVTSIFHKRIDHVKRSYINDYVLAVMERQLQKKNRLKIVSVFLAVY